jgi:hypothetical protein
MRIHEVTMSDQEIEEWKASRELCTSGKPDKALGASALSSCQAQGYRKRTSKKTQKIGNKRQSMKGLKAKSEIYGGPIKDYS